MLKYRPSPDSTLDGASTFNGTVRRWFPYAAPFLVGCEKVVTVRPLNFGSRGGADLLKNWVERVSELIGQWYERKFRVEIVDVSDVDDMLELIEEKERSIEEDARQVPASGNGNRRGRHRPFSAGRSDIDLKMGDITSIQELRRSRA